MSKDGKWTDKPNYHKQSAENNLIDIVAGFVHFEYYSKEQTEQILRDCLDVCDSAFELCSVAKAIFNFLNNRQWAIEVLKQAEKELYDSSDFKILLEEVKHITNDENWLINLMIQGLNSGDLSLKAYVAVIIFEVLGDRKLAESIIEDCLSEAINYRDHLDIFLELSFKLSGLTGLKKKILIETAKHAENSKEYCVLAFFARYRLHDKELEIRFIEKAIFIAAEISDYCKIADECLINSYNELYHDFIFEAFKIFTSRIYSLKQELALIILSISYSFLKYLEPHCYSDEENGKIEIKIKFKDKIWTKNIIELAEKVTEENINGDLERLFAYCIFKYNKKNWADYKRTSLLDED